MTDETKMNLDALIAADDIDRARRVPNNFSAIRYGIKTKGNVYGSVVGLYGTYEDAVIAARDDNKMFKPTVKTVPCIVDNTDRVIEWAENIAHAARNADVDVAKTQKSILELVQFAMRGY